MGKLLHLWNAKTMMDNNQIYEPSSSSSTKDLHGLAYMPFFYEFERQILLIIFPIGVTPKHEKHYWVVHPDGRLCVGLRVEKK